MNCNTQKQHQAPGLSYVFYVRQIEQAFFSLKDLQTQKIGTLIIQNRNLQQLQNRQRRQRAPLVAGLSFLKEHLLDIENFMGNFEGLL